MSYQFLLQLVDNEPRTKNPKVQKDLEQFKWVLSEYYTIVNLLKTADQYRYTEEELSSTTQDKEAIRAEREERRATLRADLRAVVDTMFETPYMKRWCPDQDVQNPNLTNLHRINELKNRLLNF
jgi:hypothetical protein